MRCQNLNDCLIRKLMNARENKFGASVKRENKDSQQKRKMEKIGRNRFQNRRSDFGI